MQDASIERPSWVAPQLTRLGTMRDVAKIAGNQGQGGGGGNSQQDS